MEEQAGAVAAGSGAGFGYGLRGQEEVLFWKKEPKNFFEAGADVCASAHTGQVFVLLAGCWVVVWPGDGMICYWTCVFPTALSGQGLVKPGKGKGSVIVVVTW